MRHKLPDSIAFWGALCLTLIQLWLGYVVFGFLTSFIFSFGFVGGLIFWYWHADQAPWSRIKLPYIIAFLLFIVHRVEEKYSGFFKALSEISGVPTPSLSSWSLWLLISLSVGCWLLVPWLTKRGSGIGYFFAWSFFCSMGLTELAHFVFPLFASDLYGYFPGMGSVCVLAPVAWWGMWRLRSTKV